jgi:hypothetical protein
MDYNRFINEHKGEFTYNSDVDLSKVDISDISEPTPKIKPQEILRLLSPRLSWKLNRFLFVLNLFKKFIK